jgi:colanic acid biosynthesis glycosyl transferase WcaI
MNLLIVSQYFYPENFGVNDVACDLAAKGHAVTVLTGMPNYPTGRIEPKYRGPWVRREIIRGVSVVRVPILPRGQKSYFLLALNYLSFAIIGSLLAPFLLKDRFDVILVYQLSPLTMGLPALVLRFFRCIPVVFWVQDIWPESLVAVTRLKSSIAQNTLRRLAAFIYRRCNMILVQSRAFVLPLRKLGLGDADIRYLPNSAPDHFRALSMSNDAPEGELLGGRFNVVFAGNIGSQQDPAVLLAAAEVLKGVPDIHWIIIGDGRLRSWTESEIVKRQLSNTCRLLPWQPQERLPALLGLADALLVMLSPSSVSALTVPSKLQCYLALGRPIIAAIDGETSAIVQESGAGLTCPAGYPQALAASVRALYEMSIDERNAMGYLARAYFDQHFSRETLIRSLTACLTEVSEGCAPAKLPLLHKVGRS